MDILFVQPNFRQGPGGVGAYIPYSCGIILSYALTSELVKNNINNRGFIFERTSIDKVVSDFKDIDIAVFSTYVWNKNYNYLLAKKLKQANPKIVTIFGGPEIPINNSKKLKELSFIDYVVKNEGEVIFKNLLEALITDNDVRNIPGIIIQRDEPYDTGTAERIDNLDIIPSPYLSGIFDNLIKDNPNIEWNATIETNRGCPYACTFCDWGSLTYSKVKKFNLEKVLAEIEWCGKNKVGYIDITDANFGIFPDRDEVIVDYLIYTQQKYGFPYRTGWSWAKNQKKDVLRIAKKLQSSAYNNGLTLSVQSMDDNVLTAIKRKNMEINKIAEILQECQQMNLPVTTEIILGLPLETLQSWEDGIYELLEAGQHSNIEAFNCQLLENAEMNLLQVKMNKIKSVEVSDMLSNSHLFNDVPETIHIINQTSTMTTDDIVEAYMKFLFIHTWHLGGLTQLLARFLNCYADISYKDFYGSLSNALVNFKLWQDSVNDIRSIYKNWLTTGERISNKFYNVEVTAFLLGQKLLMNIHGNQEYDEYREFIKQFALSEFSNLMDKDLFDNLLDLNDRHIVKTNYLKDYPTEQVYSYNILEYIQGSESLQKYPTRYRFTFPEETDKDITWFLENLFYRRRRNFGKTLIERVKDV